MPHRVHRTAYALAEITGIQASASTASVSFLLSDPGTDDEAISLFDLVPCPPQYLRQLSLFGSGSKCDSGQEPDDGTIPNSDLINDETGDDVVADGCESPQSPIEYLLQRSVHAGLVHPDQAHAAWLRQFQHPAGLCDTTAEFKAGEAQTEGPAAKRNRTVLKHEKNVFGQHFPLQLKKDENVLGSSLMSPPLLGPGPDHLVTTRSGAVDGILVANYIPPMNKNVYFANTFREANVIIGNQLRQTASRLCNKKDNVTKRLGSEHGSREIDGVSGVPVVLCIFDHYEMLRRLEVFMSLRGHIVRPIDGVRESDSKLTCGTGPDWNHTTAAICQGKVPLPAVASAFSSACRVWLCMLREDACGGEEDLRRLLRDAPPVDFLLVVHDTEVPLPSLCPVDPIEGAEANILKLLTHLREPLRRLVVCFRGAPCVEGETITGSKVKVSGSVFRGNKVLVPASREQLLLIQTVLSAPIAQQSPYPFSTDPQRLGPGLLERIALGSFTDSAASNLFAGFAGTAAIQVQYGGNESASACRSPHTVFSSIAELRRKFCQNPMAFGEAFPIFAVARAIVQDVFFAQLRQGCGTGSCLGRLPRVALVFHRGNPTGMPLLTTDTFLNNVRQYFSPWCVHDVGSPISVRHSISSAEVVPTPVLWNRQGGLMMLFSDEPSASLAALHDEADVVIACGKTAAAWIAANARTSLSCFAILSEVEVVPVQDTTYTWFPFDLASVKNDFTAQSSMVKRELVWRQLLEHTTKATRPSISPESKHDSRSASKRCIQIPKVLQQALILYQHLTSDTSKQGGGPEGEGEVRQEPTVLPVSSGHCTWPNLSTFIKTMVLNCLTTTPVQMGELCIRAINDE
ncbi:unnamed protein product [Phytomonas sp. EM1]|nr:unnamed protein product [Phytomonas sp. EM1]|eukprot:CCW63940.1 unnamed protein product [Phytomonas sp. isolate EM1]